MAIPYCDESDIIENLRGVSFGASTPVTSIALGNIIDQESQVIDQHIQSRFAVPPTDDDALVFLKKICIALVIFRVTAIVRPKDIMPIPNDANQDISSASTWKAAMKMLKDLQSGETVLPNTDVSTKVFVSSTLETDNVKATFEKDVRQW